MKNNIAFFDFDGTIVNRDSLLEFVKFSKGQISFLSGMILLLPKLTGLKLGILDNQNVKEAFLEHFFSGDSFAKFQESCYGFSKIEIPKYLRAAALNEINWHKSEGNKVVVVTASPENWVEPWCLENNLSCIGTRLEITDMKITGKIRGKNCHGQEKNKRILEKFDLSKYQDIYAYGDSYSDKPMLSLATKPYYKPFI